MTQDIYITPWCRAILEKLIITHLLKIFPPCMESEGSLPLHKSLPPTDTYPPTKCNIPSLNVFPHSMFCVNDSKSINSALNFLHLRLSSVSFSNPEPESLYDRKFTANQFILATRPLRLTTSISFFK
jgi:hypothetical protein